MRKLCLLAGLLFVIAAPLAAAPNDIAPRWNGLTTEQKEFLLEAFRLDAGQQALFHDNVPIEIKQAALDSLWGMLTPERRLQVLLYAHIERPFDQAAESATRVDVPRWDSLTETQKKRALDRFRLDPSQQMVWQALSPELRQAAFEMLWNYLDAAQRQEIVAP
ncbi:MAG: hypothetical protein HY319_03510 [Armatimonadetes bacterium]|nr:hypothetical protein [Armatimonadota bacterium]